MNDKFYSLLKEIFDYAPEEDVPIRDLYDKFPVHDVQGVHEKSINQEIMIPYLERIVAVKRTEEKIKKHLNIALVLLNSLSEDSVISKDFRINVGHALWHANHHLEVKHAKKAFLYSEGGAIIVVEDKFPEVNDLLYCPITNKLIISAIGEVQQGISQSTHRYDNFKRRELRKAISKNYDWLYRLHVDNNYETIKYHDSKIDRLVVDIFDTSMETWQLDVKSSIKENTKDLQKRIPKSRIVTEEFIESLEKAEFTDSKTIDQLVKDFMLLRKTGLAEGYAYNGTIVAEVPIGKLIFTYNPKKSGAPVRLRVLTNVQNLVKQQLWEEYPEKKALYEAHTWSKGTEHNFIMPEDYDYYLAHEASTCHMIEQQAKAIYCDMVKKYCKMKVYFPDKLVVHVSQCEVCYEVPFIPQEPRFLTNNDVDNPHLWEYMFWNLVQYHKYLNKYGNFKIEMETNRPMFYCDLPTMDPNVPLMQYKIYPKFRNLAGQTMIRYEMTPNQFTKFSCGDATDEIPLSLKALSNPAYYRETIETFLQFELFNNGLEGNGYNLRNKPVTKSEQEKLQLKILGLAIFKTQKQLDKYYPLFLSFVETGMLPSGFPSNYKKRMLEIGVIGKKRHGIYCVEC